MNLKSSPGALAQILIIALLIVLPTPPARAANTFHVQVKNHHFIPQVLRIQSGDQVVITNADRVHHHPFSLSKDSPLKGTAKLKPGESITLTFRNPAADSVSVSFFDELHSQEKLLVIVMPDAKVSAVSAAGRWKRDNDGYLQEISEAGGSLTMTTVKAPDRMAFAFKPGEVVGNFKLIGPGRFKGKQLWKWWQGTTVTSQSWRDTEMVFSDGDHFAYTDGSGSWSRVKRCTNRRCGWHALIVNGTWPTAC